MMQFDPQKYVYPSRRNVVYARRRVACTSIPQGAQIGLEIMGRGGNAVDAAVAMAAAMPLLEPTGNGLGSDCFALVWMSPCPPSWSGTGDLGKFPPRAGFPSPFPEPWEAGRS